MHKQKMGWLDASRVSHPGKAMRKNKYYLYPDAVAKPKKNS